MTLDDYIVKVDGLLAALQTEMPAIADEVALNALALVKNRIIDQGKGIEGASYSTHEMLATQNEFIVKSAFKPTIIESTRLPKDGGKARRKKDGSLVRSGAKKVKRELWIKFPNAKKAVPVMILPGGYRQFREIQGRPGDHVNLSYSGKMWQGTTIVARVHEGNRWMTVIGGSTLEAQDKLSWMTTKYGPFLTVLSDEQQLLQNVFDKRLSAILNRFIQ